MGSARSQGWARLHSDCTLEINKAWKRELVCLECQRALPGKLRVENALLPSGCLCSPLIPLQALADRISALTQQMLGCSLQGVAH